jgi:L-sorbose 1-phosphate reductase
VKTEAAYITGAGQCEVMTTELPPLGASEVLMKVVSSSMCYSTYKAMTLGSEHKRVPDGLDDLPVMTGHEFAGVIEEVGENYKDRYHKGQVIAVQPAMGLPSGYSPGYSYPYYGGDATYTIIPEIAIEKGGILSYEEEYFADASLAEPMSCIIGAFHASYHTTPFVYDYEMGIKKGGNLALLGAAGPMGIGAIDYAINGPYQPRLIVVTDLDQARLDRAASLIPPSVLDGTGRRLVYMNTSKVDDEVAAIRAVSGDQGYDDVMVLVPHRGLIETADRLLGVDGCLNFFAGPTDKSFSASINFYNVHYERTHLVGTSGGSTADMQESLTMSAAGKLNPSLMVTHVGGIDAVPPTLRDFPSIPGGKKLFYPHVHLPLVAIDELRAHAERDPRFAGLADICEANNNVWNLEAERYLLAHWA